MRHFRLELISHKVSTPLASPVATNCPSEENARQLTCSSHIPNVRPTGGEAIGMYVTFPSLSPVTSALPLGRYPIQVTRGKSESLAGCPRTGRSRTACFVATDHIWIRS